ncbi:hypothetical protein [Mycoplasma sp. P36-A1]|uniref:hypothetical protein n=1 Tax=Mycoplasma sp. P36-A1 TaxID=3252900 RepID=UPI003C2B942C
MNNGLRTVLLAIIMIASFTYAFILGIFLKDAFYFTLLGLLTGIMIINLLNGFNKVFRLILLWIIVVATIAYSYIFVTTASLVMIAIILIVVGALMSFKIKNESEVNNTNNWSA